MTNQDLKASTQAHDAVLGTGNARSGLLPVEEARSRIVAMMRVLGSERVDLASAMGRVLAEDIVARLAHPPTAVSAMDGYALCSGDIAGLPARLRKIGVAKAGAGFGGLVTAGTCVRIFTGATVPDGADTIALQEDAVERHNSVELSSVPNPGRHIRAAGLDFAAGQLCIGQGRALTARDIGVIASCGHASVCVRRKPRVAILATGDELVEPGDPPGKDRIVGSNSAALAAAVTGWGGAPINRGIVPDRIEAIAAAADTCSGADLLITTGGASVGDHDLVQAGLAARGFRADFWKIAMRPGKPLMFGRIDGMPVIGIPGNPVSALVCALLFVRPAMVAMLGLAITEPPFERVILGAPLPANDGREEYLRVRLERDAAGGLVAYPFPTQDSSMLLTLAQADGLVRRRPLAPPAPAGAQVDAIIFDRLGGCY